MLTTAPTIFIIMTHIHSLEVIMSTETLNMHRVFLAEIKEKREKIAEELTRLNTVEKYHLDMISQVSVLSKSTRIKADTLAENNPENTSLDGAKKREACAIALRALGGRQKTVKIAEWLCNSGYGEKLDKRVFFNACYTAMNRKREVFKRSKGGYWELIEHTDTKNES
jgi:hypothetical protein